MHAPNTSNDLAAPQMIMPASAVAHIIHVTAICCHKKLLDSAKNLITSFHLKSAKCSEILPKGMLFLW